jgi:hypothetical protein
MKILMKPTATGAEYPLAGYTRDVSGISHMIHAGLFLDTFSTSRVDNIGSSSTRIYMGDATPASSDTYNSSTNYSEFHVLFSDTDYSSSSWFLDTKLIPMISNGAAQNTPPFSGSFASNLFIGYARYGTKYGKIPTYNHSISTEGVNKFSTVGVMWPQADLVRLKDGVVKYAYFISYKSLTDGQAVAMLDVNDVVGTNTHSSVYEIILDDVNVTSAKTTRIKSFNAKVKYQVKNI